MGRGDLFIVITRCEICHMCVVEEGEEKGREWGWSRSFGIHGFGSIMDDMSYFYCSFT